MATANTIDISRFQDPSSFDYQAAKDAGIKTIIIRGSTGISQDIHAKEHIANAKKYGFNWHLYHDWHNGPGEADFAVKNAHDLGLAVDQYLFLDMEGNLAGNWSQQFETFRSKAISSFKVGLYCSDSPYKQRFNDNQMQSENVARWIASYSYEPKNYDIWQMSGSGGGGFGSYKGDVDRDYDKNGILLPAKPYVPAKPEDIEYRQIVQDWGRDTAEGFYGRGYSPDNGKTFVVTDTSWGRKYRQEDADRLWPFLVDKVKAVQSGSLSVSWDDIQNKPDVALKSEIPDTSKFVTYDEIPTMPDMSRYALKSQIPSVTGLVKEAELDNYVKKDDLTNLNLDGYVKVSDLIDYAKKSDIPQSMTWNQITGKPNVATKDDVSYLKSLIGSSSSGDAGLSIEAITELIKHHLKASVNAQTGNLEISVDDVSNGSIADAVATKVAQSLTFTMQGNELVVQIGGTE